MPQFGGYDSGLQRIEPEIPSYNLMMVFRFGAVSTQALQFFSPSRIVGNNHSRIASSAEILGGEEGKASIVPHGAGSTAFVFGPNRLRRVFDDHKAMLPSDSHNFIHLRHLAVQMNWNDGPSLASYFRRDLIWVQVVSDRINVNKHRRGSQADGCAHGGKERVRRRDDFIACADILSHQACQ